MAHTAMFLPGIQGSYSTARNRIAMQLKKTELRKKNKHHTLGAGQHFCMYVQELHDLQPHTCLFQSPTPTLHTPFADIQTCGTAFQLACQGGSADLSDGSSDIQVGEHLVARKRHPDDGLRDYCGCTHSGADPTFRISTFSTIATISDTVSYICCNKVMTQNWNGIPVDNLIFTLVPGRVITRHACFTSTERDLSSNAFADIWRNNDDTLCITSLHLHKIACLYMLRACNIMLIVTSNSSHVMTEYTNL